MFMSLCTNDENIKKKIIKQNDDDDDDGHEHWRTMTRSSLVSHAKIGT